MAPTPTRTRPGDAVENSWLARSNTEGCALEEILTTMNCGVAEPCSGAFVVAAAVTNA
jgi:hypothetical protein